MIVMINERNGHKTRFKNYRRLYSHIDSQQRTKIYHRPHQLIDDWLFACHSYRRVMAFHEFVSIQKKNARKTTSGKFPKFDVLEMSYDRSTKPTMVSITSDLDVESLLEDWCRRYCGSHGYKLVEIQDDDGILHIKRTSHDFSNNGDLVS
jgi:hypothetical protein